MHPTYSCEDLSTYGGSLTMTAVMGTRLGRRLRHLWWPVGSDPDIVQQVRQRVWVVNTILFLGLVVPALLAGSAGWPLGLTVAVGLVGTCLWEAAALRSGRFPLWADVLETALVAAVAWRYPSGSGLLILVLAFAIPALGFRMLYSSSQQATARTASLVAA